MHKNLDCRPNLKYVYKLVNRELKPHSKAFYYTGGQKVPARLNITQLLLKQNVET